MTQQQTEWTIEVTCALSVPFEHDETGVLAERLEHVHAALSLSRNGKTLEVTMTVVGLDLFEAIEEARRSLRDAPGLEVESFIAVDARSAWAHRDRMLHPTIPELVDLTGVGEMAGVSRQRASVLSRGEGFPEPAMRVATGPLYAAEAIKEWVAARTVRSGRPPKRIAG